MDIVNEMVIYDGCFTWDMTKTSVSIAKKSKIDLVGIPPILLQKITSEFPNIKINLMINYPYSHYAVNEIKLLMDVYINKYKHIKVVTYALPMIDLLEEDWDTINKTLQVFGAACKELGVQSRIIVLMGFLHDDSDVHRIGDFAEQAGISAVVLDQPEKHFMDFLLDAHELSKGLSIPVGIMADCRDEEELQAFVNAKFPIKVLSGENILELD